jgi:hypothetical protein
VTFQDASGMITRVDRLQHLTQAFREHSPTVRAQLAGIALIIVPGLAQAVPLDGALAGVLRILAVLVGFVGVLVVFGGMLEYAYRQLAAPSLDDVLLAVPYARTVWVCLVLLGLALGIGAAWCLVLVFSRGWDEYLAAALMLALPAATLAWLTWRARAMRA